MMFGKNYLNEGDEEGFEVVEEGSSDHFLETAPQILSGPSVDRTRTARTAAAKEEEEEAVIGD
jgi:hypothetical protein